MEGVKSRVSSFLPKFINLPAASILVEGLKSQVNSFLKRTWMNVTCLGLTIPDSLWWDVHPCSKMQGRKRREHEWPCNGCCCNPCPPILLHSAETSSPLPTQPIEPWFQEVYYVGTAPQPRHGTHKSWLNPIEMPSENNKVVNPINNHPHYHHSCGLYKPSWNGNLVGGFNPSEKYDSQLGWLFPIYGKNKFHVPNHQPAIYIPLPEG